MIQAGGSRAGGQGERGDDFSCVVDLLAKARDLYQLRLMPVVCLGIDHRVIQRRLVRAVTTEYAIITFAARQ